MNGLVQSAFIGCQLVGWSEGHAPAGVQRSFGTQVSSRPGQQLLVGVGCYEAGRLPQHALAASCIGGHLNNPYEQKTQQPPAFG